MKKKTLKTKRAARKLSRARKSPTSSFSFQRIVIITTCVVIAMVAILVNKNRLTQSVAGISIARGLFAQVKVGWDPVTGANSYNLYYKQKGASEFTNAVRNIPSSVTEYTISYLTKGKEYDYKLAAVGPNGQEFFWTAVYELSKPESM